MRHIISRQIRALEASLGVNLFERKTRAIELTAIGTEYYRKVAPLLASIDAASNEIRRGEKKTQLREQMPDFFASELAGSNLLFQPRVLLPTGVRRSWCLILIENRAAGSKRRHKELVSD